MSVRPYTRPLNFRRLIKDPDRRLNMVPFVDLLLIGLFLTITTSRYIFAPGISIDLPKMDESFASGVATDAVLTVLPMYYAGMNKEEGGEDLAESLVVFDGEIFRSHFLKEKLSNFVAVHEHSKVLLIKAYSSVQLDKLLSIFHAAREAGFERVQLATQSSTTEKGYLSIE